MADSLDDGARAAMDTQRPSLSRGDGKAASVLWSINLWLLTLPAIIWVCAEVGALYLPNLGRPSRSRWSNILPSLASTTGRELSMGLHFICGLVVMLLGVHNIRASSRSTSRRLARHRVVGRVFVVAALLTSLGGLSFIVQKCTLVGGWRMSLSFALYGVLLAGTSTAAWWSARRGDLDAHRRWAFHAFGLAMASFLYRGWYWFLQCFGYEMPQAYGDGGMRCNSAGECDMYRRWPDQVLDWAFFLPNLIAVELVLWGYRAKRGRLITVVLMMAVPVLLGMWVGFANDLLRKT